MGSGWLRSVAVHIEKLLSPGFVVFGSGSDLKIKDIILFNSVSLRVQCTCSGYVYTLKVKHIFMVVT